MIKIAIVEDQYNEYRTLEEQIHGFESNHGIRFDIRHFDAAEPFLEDSGECFDIVFMNIGLPGMNGMDAAKVLRDRDEQTTIIFVTCQDAYALDGYSVGAIAYGLRPVSMQTVQNMLEKAITRMLTEEDHFLTIPTEEAVKRIAASSIRYIEEAENDLVYHTFNGDIVTPDALQESEEWMDMAGFSRLNGKILVNVRYVTEITNDSVWVGKDILPVSKQRRKPLIERLYRVA